MTRIGIYASARNEEKNLPDWLATVKDADVVVVNDTGSTDRTSELLQAADVRAEQLRVEPMFLSNALNIAMDLLPDDIDIAVRLDLDERLQPGWRQQLEDAFTGRPTIYQVWFDHRGCIYRHDRAHSRHGFQWALPVHEVLLGDGARLPVDVTIEHHQDLTKDRSQVLGELETALDADPDNLRLVHYLGREYTYRADWQHAIPLLRRHADSDAICEERSESWRLLGDSYTALMAVEDVPLRPYRQAAITCPQRREGWVALADLCHKQGRWEECRAAAEIAFAITERSWYFNWPFAWGSRPHDLAALACWFLDDHDNAIEHGKRAVELAPDDPRLADNLRWYMGEELADAVQ